MGRFQTDPNGPVELDEFRSLLAALPDRPRDHDLESPAGWIRAHPGKTIVTDVKSDLVRAHALTSDRHPDPLSV